MAKSSLGPIEDMANSVTELTDHFVDAGIKKIDKALGKGAAKENPALIAAYVRASSQSFDTIVRMAFEAQEAMDLDQLINDFEQEEK